MDNPALTLGPSMILGILAIEKFRARIKALAR